jgi:hypothetical protein
MRKTLRMVTLALAAAFASMSLAAGPGFDELKARLKGALAVLKGRKLQDGDVLHLTQNVRIKLVGADGQVKEEREEHNVIVTAGKNKLLAADGTSLYLKSFPYMAIGTGTTAAAIGDTALQTELSRSTVITPTNPTAASLKFSFSFTSLTGAITECGLLSASSGGTLLNRLVFAAVNITSSDTLVVEITIT